MKLTSTLMITSLLSIVLFSFHWVDEISRGFEPGTLQSLWGIVILVIWLYGTVPLAGRRSGYIITLLGAIFGVGVVVLHMSKAGMVGGRIPVNSPGVFFWVWILIAIGVSSSISLILSVRGLWSTRARVSAQ
jgi:hypothetical protein